MLVKADNSDVKSGYFDDTPATKIRKSNKF